jgi:hypothetical protein
MPRFLSILLLTGSIASAQIGTPEPLAGTLDGNVYTSPTGAFKMEVPVLPALGGVVTDTDKVVTFHDDFGLQITVGVFAQDASLRWEYSTRGPKDYLIYFFTNFVLTDFKRFCPATQVESAGFSADFLDGALFTYILMPGGSIYAEHTDFDKADDVPVAKRGNLVFVKNGYTFVISSELAERVTQGGHYGKSPAEENQVLRNRLVEIVKKIQFLKQAPAD